MVCRCRPFANLDAVPTQVLHCDKSGFVGHVVARENRHTSGKGRQLHEVADGLTFVYACGLDLEHTFAAKELKIIATIKGRKQPIKADAFELWRVAVVQSDGVGLVFDQQTRVGVSQALHRRQRLIERRRSSGGLRAAIGKSALRTMFASGRQAQRLQKMVNFGYWPAGDDGHRAAEMLLQDRERVHGAAVHLYGVGRGRDVGNGAVEIQEKGGLKVYKW